MSEWREEIDREIRHLREKIETRLDAMDRALELQAEEYLRRLEGLNHEAERIRRASDLSVSAEKYEADQRAAQDRYETLKERFGEFKVTVVGQQNRWTGAIAVLVVLASLLAKYLLP